MATSAAAGTGAEPEPVPVTPMSVRVSEEERAALEYLCDLFPNKYRGMSSVLTDYSLSEAVTTYRRAKALAGAAA